MEEGSSFGRSKSWRRGIAPAPPRHPPVCLDMKASRETREATEANGPLAIESPAR
jgi:hypothetical protein